MESEVTNRRRWWGRRSGERSTDVQPAERLEPVPIADEDPLSAVLVSSGGPVALDGLGIESPALEALRAQKVEVVVPLVREGRLLGTLSLGRRRSDQPYAADDQRLLADLAAQAAPAAQLSRVLRQQERQAEERQRYEQELQVARLIQQTLLPKELPSLAGWELDAYYRPAREVGGDFYDFIERPDGTLVVIEGDVTDKGVPAALVMATCRSILRSVAVEETSPGRMLERANDALVEDIPPNMFVTCLVAVLDPASGSFRFANAGHNLPYLRTSDGVRELRATGMPLGLMPGLSYEEASATVGTDETMLICSDGIVEAMDAQREMFGFDRVLGLVGAQRSGRLIDRLVTEMDEFSGGDPGDDVTLVVLRRLASGGEQVEAFDVESAEGNEREARERAMAFAGTAGLPADRLEQFGTAVAEATMNAMEHGNGYDSAVPVRIRLRADAGSVAAVITDQGGADALPDAEDPDIEKKLDGLQSPRGWGLFLIEQMVDEVTTTTEGDERTVTLTMHLGGDA